MEEERLDERTDLQIVLKAVGGTETTQEHVRFEVFMALTMKNAIFWDIKTQFVPHRRHITSPLQSSAS
jgi:hypothetical protein